MDPADINDRRRGLWAAARSMANRNVRATVCRVKKFHDAHLIHRGDRHTACGGGTELAEDIIWIDYPRQDKK